MIYSFILTLSLQPHQLSHHAPHSTCDYQIFSLFFSYMPSASGRALTHYPFSLLGILSISFTHSHQIPTCMPCSCLVFRIGGTIAPLLSTSPMTELQGGSCWSWTTYSFGPRPGISRTFGLWPINVFSHSHIESTSLMFESVCVVNHRDQGTNWRQEQRLSRKQRRGTSRTLDLPFAASSG